MNFKRFVCTALLACGISAPALAQVSPYSVTVDVQRARAPKINLHQANDRTIRVQFQDGGTNLNATGASPKLAYFSSVHATQLVYATTSSVANIATGEIDFLWSATQLNTNGNFFYEAALDKAGVFTTIKQGKMKITRSPPAAGVSDVIWLSSIDFDRLTESGTISNVTYHGNGVGLTTVTSSGVSASAMTEAMLKAVDTAADEDFLTYETTTGDFEWHSLSEVDHGGLGGLGDDDHTGYRLESADHTHASAGMQAGQLDHGSAITGLTDDDHTIYRLESADHTHASTGMQAGKIDHGTAIDGLTDDDHTIYRLESADHTHATTGLQAGTLDHGSALTGMTDDDHTQYRLESEDHTHASTGAQAGTLDHGAALTGMTDDDHTQYRLESEDHTHASTGAQAGTIDHGVITGVTDDDHTIYRLESADHTHASTGIQAGTIDHGVITGVADDDHTIYRLESADHTHASTGMQAGTIDHGVITGLTDDDHTQYRKEDVDHTHESTGAEAGKLDHGDALDGLGDDDHPQYLVGDEIDASSELLAIMDDESGTGALLFGTSPTIATPALTRPVKVLTGAGPHTLTAAECKSSFVTNDTASTINLSDAPTTGMWLTILVIADVAVAIDDNDVGAVLIWKDGASGSTLTCSGSSGESVTLFWDGTKWRAILIEGSWTLS